MLNYMAIRLPLLAVPSVRETSYVTDLTAMEYGLDHCPLQLVQLLRRQVVESVVVCTKSQMEWYAPG